MKARVAGFLAVVVFLLMGLASSAQAVSFASAVPYGAGSNPESVAVGDFNGDGDLDLAVANYSSNNVSILLGIGDGTFPATPSYTYGVGTSPRSVDVGDFNGDSKPDLAVANWGSANVSILLGNGNGTFASAVNYGAGTSPYSVAVGDFNGDGKHDLAVANVGSNNVSILLGVGNGTFQTAVNYGVGNYPYTVAVGDFNGDGDLDLAVANYSSNNVSILLGIGDGTFASAVNYAAGTGPLSVTAGDFNRDGKLDLAVANYGSNNVSILLGVGNGTFGAAVNYGVGTSPRSVDVGDFNGDGKPNLAVTNYGSNNVSILLGNGNGTFASAVNYGAGTSPYSVAVGDFNGDGKHDLVAANFTGTVSILLNTTVFDPAGVFAKAVNYGAGINPQSVTAGDFNGDGKLDLAVANEGGNVSILLGYGSGTFQAAVSYGAGIYSVFVAAGDFNGDGKPDLAVANAGSNNVSILLGIGDGTFAAAVSYGAGNMPECVAVDDFNRDGKLDLAVANAGSNNVSILLGIGDGTFAAAVNYPVGSWSYSITVGDFNGDGKLDLAVVNSSSNNVSILLGIGNGTFAAAVNYPVGSWPVSVAVGDFNRDGKPDLAVTNLFDHNVSILLGDGDGTFTPASTPTVAVGTNPVFVAVNDFNRDGKPDLAVTNGGSNNVSILLGVGDGTFASAVNYGAGINPSSVAVGDFNRDGKPDLAVTNFYGNNVCILLNTNFVFPNPNLAINNLQINGGLTLTASPSVTLTYTTSGSPSPTHIRTSTGIPDPVTGAFWSAWKLLPVGPPHTLNLGTGNGYREVFAQVKDASGNMSPVARDSIILDTVAPIGRVKLNGGAATVKYYVSGTTVRLHLAMFDRNLEDYGGEMRIKVDAPFANPDELWESFLYGKDIDLNTAGIPPILRTHTIYVQFRDAVGKKSPVYAPQIKVTSTGPDWPGGAGAFISNLRINDDAAYATSPTVALQYTVSSTDVKARYCFTNSAGTTAWTTWETISSSNVLRTLTLSGANGLRQVYVQLKENATGKMTDPEYVEITLDTAAPGGAVWINNGAASVTRTGGTTYVTLTLLARDNGSGIDKMAITEWTSPIPNDGDFIAFTPTVVYPLHTSTTYPAYVFVWFKDKAGRLSVRKSDGINVLGP